MAGKKRRVRHPGVSLVKPQPARGIGWRAQVVLVDTCEVRDGKVMLSTGKVKRESLPADLTTTDQREAWAVTKARELAKRIEALEGGAPKATGAALESVIKRYYADHPQLRDKTRKGYEAATNALLAWATAHRLKEADKLTRAHLLSFRASVLHAKKHALGTNERTDETRSAHSVNRELRAVRTVLGYLVDADALPKLTFDDLRRGLKKLRAEVERIDFLKGTECATVLETALAHDAQRFRITRKEHDAGTRTYGKTPRYVAIAPFAAFVLLTGARLAEAIRLDWADVDLEAGEIHLAAAATKTHKARTIGLEVSPGLAALLATLREHNSEGSVFGLSTGLAEAAAKRLRNEKHMLGGRAWQAPATFNWQTCRRTCGTFLTNAPGIFGAASAYRSAKQLGHSVQVAEKHYLGLVRGIPAEAKTLEAAMGIEAVLTRVTDAAQATPRMRPAPDAERKSVAPRVRRAKS